MNIVLKKNKFYEEGGKQPYFKLAAAPEQEGGKWEEIAAFWLKTDKAGNKYYSGKFEKNVNITITPKANKED